MVPIRQAMLVVRRGVLPGRQLLLRRFASGLEVAAQHEPRKSGTFGTDRSLQRGGSLEPMVLSSGADYCIVQKPASLQLRRDKARTNEMNLEGWIAQTVGNEVSHCQVVTQLERGCSGAVFVATCRAVAQEVTALQDLHQIITIYTAIVRGRLQLNDLIRCQRRLCKPSEGSDAWRLALLHREGREACTLVIGRAHGMYNGEICTLVELRPLTHVPRQCLLHCAAIGHPIVGDNIHDAERCLDWKFSNPLYAPRLLLHCWRIAIPLARGTVEANAPDPLSQFLNPAPMLLDVDHTVHGGGSSLLASAEVQGLTTKLSRADAWSTFAGGLGEHVVDHTHWDKPIRSRACKGPPYGPPEWDDRAPERRAELLSHLAARKKALSMRICPLTCLQ